MKNLLSERTWETLRLPCLGMVLGGALVALGVGVKTPLQPRPAIASYSFPAEIPLRGWQQVSRAPLPQPENEKLIPVASQGYRYQREGIPLTIETRYLTATKGDVTQFIRWYTDIPDSVKMEIDSLPNTGSYVFFVHQDRAYLSTCQHPRGKNTATGREYLQSKAINGITPQQLIGWIFGKDTLFDQRCLWSNFSVPLSPAGGAAESDRLLTESWRLWYDWWQKNYPKS